MMQWTKLTKRGLFFNLVSPAVHTLLPLLLQQPLQPLTCMPEHCPGKTGLPSSVFQVVLKCLYIVLLFKVPKLLSQFGFVWTETMQLVSGKVEFNACQHRRRNPPAFMAENPLFLEFLMIYFNYDFSLSLSLSFFYFYILILFRPCCDFPLFFSSPPPPPFRSAVGVTVRAISYMR